MKSYFDFGDSDTFTTTEVFLFKIALQKAVDASSSDNHFANTYAEVDTSNIRSERDDSLWHRGKINL